MSDTTGRHRAPGRYNPITEIGQIVAQAGTPVAKGSAVLAASGGLVAAIAIPAQAATADDAEVATPAKQSASQSATPATAAVTAPAETSAKGTSAFGKVEVEPVAKPTGPSPAQLQERAERKAERKATAERERQERAEAERQEEQEAQERASEQTQEQSSEETQEQSSERSESASSRDRERQAPSSNASSGSTKPKSSPAPSSASSSNVTSIAKQYIGTPYVFGGASPSGFDCSGLTQYVFGKAGKSIPRVTGAQQAAATPVSSPQPGDLVFFGSPAYHVGIYVGNGQMIDAPRSGASVTTRPVFDGVSGYGRL